MGKFITKMLFLFVLFLLFSSQNLITQIPFTHPITQSVMEYQDLSKDIKKISHEEPDAMLQFTAGGHVLGFRKGDVVIASGDHALRVEFVNARSVSPTTEEISPNTENNRQAAEPLGRVTYRDLWDGVTLAYETHNNGVVKSTYTVQPVGIDDASPVDQIRLRYNMPVEVDKSGSLVVFFETGQMRESRPVAWQEIDGQIRPVEVSFRSVGQQEIGFKAGSYDLRFPLVIDPVLSWHTFLGSSDTDKGLAIAVDTNGNIYVAGQSDSSWGSPVNAYNGRFDAFVAKLDSSGVLQWNTFMGSENHDLGYTIALDGSGNVYVAGTSNMTWGTPINPYAGGNNDVFAAKLNSSGVRQWNTFIGSTSSDMCYAIAVDTNGDTYLTGYSQTTWGTPINPYSGNNDSFTAKLNNNGVFQWNTFLGSTDNDFSSSIAVDISGNVYVTGTSYATWGTPIDPYTGGADTFVAKLSTNGALQWNTFMGSSSDDQTWDITVDSIGNIYVTGDSYATWGTPIDPYTGGADTFVAKLSNNGALQWNTFMGSSNEDLTWGITVDSIGNIYVIGTSYATWGTPITPFIGGFDAFVAKLDSNGARQWNTFMGSTSSDYGYGIEVDSIGNVYVTGYSDATWGSPKNAPAGGYDAFVAKIVTTDIRIYDGHDFDGNGTSDISVYRPIDGMWYIKDGTSQQWGAPGDIPAHGNYDLDAATEIAVFRPSNGFWYISGISIAQWGTYGDIPVPHDYNGDDITDLAVWRPSNGVWYISGVGNYQWGQYSDYPTPGDYNGDGVDEMAVWRPAEGVWYINGIGFYPWGAAGDIPVPADYNGDGKTDLAVFRPANGIWYIQYMGGGTAAIQWGMANDVPVPGDYDGNGTTEVAIWRPSNGLWYIYGNGTYHWGQSSDIPLVR